MNHSKRSLNSCSRIESNTLLCKRRCNSHAFQWISAYFQIKVTRLTRMRRSSSTFPAGVSHNVHYRHIDKCRNGCWIQRPSWFFLQTEHRIWYPVFLTGSNNPVKARPGQKKPTVNIQADNLNTPPLGTCKLFIS